MQEKAEKYLKVLVKHFEEKINRDGKITKKFATTINCMDGRVQEPVLKKLKEQFDVKNVDMITAPGPNLVLSENKEEHLVKSIKESLGVSVNEHGSSKIALVAHFDCAGNPKNKKGQIEDVKKSISRINEWGFNVKILGVWVNSSWKAEILDI